MYSFRAKPYTLHFRFGAGTSRGVLTQKHGWLIKLTDPSSPGRSGIGECSLIPGLSPDLPEDIESLIRVFEKEGIEPQMFINSHAAQFPAMAFALEMALASLERLGSMKLFPSRFTEGHMGIPINGLVWMGSIEEMKARIRDKIEQGYHTIKLKVGALNFDDELALIREIRAHYSPTDISLRLDANGAFGTDEALEKLERLSQFHIHSIEQPIRAGQPEEMARICCHNPIPVALDEELIAVPDGQMQTLLENIRPQYIILKPSLLGGLKRSAQWIDHAQKLDIGWWVTSALESNVGLSAISQWTATLNNPLPQGLGTGQLYNNNFKSPLHIREAQLWHDPQIHWEIPF
ncbi:MAG: o-succinylbenzoate synthase [Bacteroidia bacterium]|jgi:o-succinylbenzoate synthase|nr:o-succinylbenzoate synthase [Bacteroidia bacterium]